MHSIYVAAEVKISVLAGVKDEPCFATTPASTATAFTSLSGFLALELQWHLSSVKVCFHQ